MARRFLHAETSWGNCWLKLLGLLFSPRARALLLFRPLHPGVLLRSGRVLHFKSESRRRFGLWFRGRYELFDLVRG